MKIGKINMPNVGKANCPAEEMPTDSNRASWEKSAFTFSNCGQATLKNAKRFGNSFVTDGKKSPQPKQGDILPPEPWPPFKPEPKPRPEPCPWPRPKPLPVPSPNPCPECRKNEEESN